MHKAARLLPVGESWLPEVVARALERLPLALDPQGHRGDGDPLLGDHEFEESQWLALHGQGICGQSFNPKS